MRNLVTATVAASFAILAAGCGGDSAGTGRLSLALTDAPVDGASHVVVLFTGVEVKPAGGEARSFDFDEPRSIDLLAFQGGDTAPLLQDVVVPSGDYDWIRLKVSAEDDGVMDSYIDLDDGRHELVVPSGAQTGLKLVGGLTVPDGGAAAYTLDFDLRKSVHKPMNASTDYVLRPTLRIVQDDDSGSLSGSVDASLLTDGCMPAVYVYSGSGVTPDDIGGSGADPVTTAAVVYDGGQSQYRYVAAFLPAGSYTAAFTCASDDPDTDDAASFTGTTTVSIQAQQATTLDFAPAS